MPVNSVLMVGQTFYPVLGGAEKQAYELSRALARRDVAVTVLTRRVQGLPAEENLDGVRVIRFPVFIGGALDSLHFMLRVFAWMLLNSCGFEVVHVHLASSPGVAAALAGRLLGRRVFIKLGRGRGLDELSLSKGSLFGRLKLYAYSLLKPKVLVLTSDACKWLSESREFPGVEPVLFRNGVDTGRYSPPQPYEKAAAKAAVGLGNETVFLTVGRLVPEKRIKEFLEVWAGALAAETARPRARLVVIGKGPEEERIKRAVAELHLHDSVLLAGPREDLLPWYRAADVFALPSLTEGLSNSMLEAMSCGVAVMAGRVDGAKDVVEDGVSGLLFDPLKPAEIAKCLKAFFDDRGLALRLGERARAVIVERYSMARVADDALKLYEGAA
jgi:glycosyltransferase involved in cell wall biosynthesis